jgi:putative endonuclease
MARRIERPPGAGAPHPARRAAFARGLSAESRAALLLLAKGYRIAARRWKTPVGEIDIVARRRNLLVFVEVKARAGFDAAAFAVTPHQRRRILAAARAWLARHPDDATRAMRFDAVLVVPWRLPRHVPGAFDEDG